MTASHRHFELLCALAASDELNEMEVSALRRHSLDCKFCQVRLLEMTHLRSHLLLTHGFHRKSGRLPGGMQERFIARAIAEGVPLTGHSTVAAGKLGMAVVLFGTLLITAAVVNHFSSTRSISNESSLEMASISGPLRAAKAAPVDFPTGPARIFLPRRARRKGYAVRPPQRTVPIYLAAFQNRDFSMSPDFSIRLHLPLGTLERPRFTAPVLLSRSSALNLLANFQEGGSSTSSRTFEFSDSIVSRFVRVSGCEPR